MGENSSELRTRSRGVNNNSTRVMLNVLSKYEEGFRVCYLNAGSLNPTKIDYLRYLFDNSCVDVICITETCFKPDTDDSFLSLLGYNLIRNDRVTPTIGGGVAIYCRSTLNCKVIDKSDGSGVEYLIIEVFDNITKCIVSCVYCPNRSSSPEPFFSALSNISSLYGRELISSRPEILNNESSSH